jgi:hypothetical protein
MKQIIMDVLDDMSDSQINLASSAARETVSSLISAALKAQGYNNRNKVNSYLTADLSEEEKKARESWVCSICGENTFEVDYDYIGSGTNHLGCELKSETKSSTEPVQTLDDGGGITYRENAPELKFDTITEELYTDEPHEELPFREKNWLQKKHEDKVFGNVQKQVYLEMTSDGLPEGGDAQAVLESHKLADEIVDNKGKWIYESPDGGETVFRRPFSDYDPEKKEEIDWETKEPTGRKFTEYNNGNWRSKDEG